MRTRKKNIDFRSLVCGGGLDQNVPASDEITILPDQSLEVEVEHISGQPGPFDAGWRSEICQWLLALQKDGTLCDLTIKGEDGDVKAHACILARWSTKVSAILQKVRLEANQGKRFLFTANLDAGKCKNETIQKVIEACYVGPNMEYRNSDFMYCATKLGINFATEAERVLTQVVGEEVHIHLPTGSRTEPVTDEDEQGRGLKSEPPFTEGSADQDPLDMDPQLSSNTMVVQPPSAFESMRFEMKPVQLLRGKKPKRRKIVRKHTETKGDEDKSVDKAKEVSKIIKKPRPKKNLKKMLLARRNSQLCRCPILKCHKTFNSKDVLRQHLRSRICFGKHPKPTVDDNTDVIVDNTEPVKESTSTENDEVSKEEPAAKEKDTYFQKTLERIDASSRKHLQRKAWLKRKSPESFEQATVKEGLTDQELLDGEDAAKRETYVCDRCGTGYLTKASYDNHIKTRKRCFTEEERELLVPKNLRVDDMGIKVSTHIKSLHSIIYGQDKSTKRHTCPLCIFTAKNAATFYKHMGKAHGLTYLFQCLICDKLLSTNQNAKLHIFDHRLAIHEGRPEVTNVHLNYFSCIKCLQNFDKEELFQQHVSYCDGHPMTICPYCGMSLTRQGLRKHILAVHQGQKNECKHCGKCFNPGALRRHIRQIHEGEKVLCAVCGKGFSAKDKLRDHELVHTGEKPHECPVCFRRFRVKCDMVKHKKLHFREKEAIEKPDKPVAPEPGQIIVSQEAFERVETSVAAQNLLLGDVYYETIQTMEVNQVTTQ